MFFRRFDGETPAGLRAVDLPAPQVEDGDDATPAVESFFAEMDWRKLNSKRISFSLKSYCSPSF